jgi:hypothetical protein
MTERQSRGRSRVIDGSLRASGIDRERSEAMARLKAVPSAAWLVVRAPDFLASDQCHFAGGVPPNPANRLLAWLPMALHRLWGRPYVAGS